MVLYTRWVLFCGFFASLVVGWGVDNVRAETKFDSPTTTVNRLISAISHREPQRGIVDQRHTRQSKQLDPLHEALEIIDLSGMSQRTLGKHWEVRSQAEQEEFMALLAQLLTHVAFPQSGAFFRDLDMTVTDERITDDRAVVGTTVKHTREGEIEIDYMLIQHGGSWLIQDIRLDGVSLGRNLRTQCHQIIMQSSYPELVRRMREKLSHAMVRAAP